MQMKKSADELNNDILFLIRDVVLIKDDMCRGEFDWIEGRIDKARDYYNELCRRRDGMLKDLDGMGIRDSDRMCIMSGVLLNLTCLSKYFEEE